MTHPTPPGTPLPADARPAAATSPGAPPPAPTSRGTSDADRRLPLVVWVLGAVTFLVGTTEMVVAGILPDIAAALDVSEPRAGMLITAFALGMTVGAPIMALATLRLPRRAVLVTACLLFAAGHVLGVVTDTFGLALAGRVVSALGTGTFWAVGALVATSTAGPARAASAMGVMVGGLTVANVVGVPVGAALGQRLGWQGPFWVLAVLALLAAGVVARLVPGERATTRTTVRDEVAVLRHGRLWLVYASVILTQAALLGTYSYISPLLTDRAGLSASLVPLVMLGYGAGSVAGSAIGGRLGDRTPWRAALSAAALTTLLLGALTLWATSSVTAVVLVVLLGMAGLVCNPILSAQVVAVVGPNRPLAMALNTSSFNIGIAVGSALAGTALASDLGAQGPPLAGTVLGALSLVPLTLLAWASHRAATRQVRATTR